MRDPDAAVTARPERAPILRETEAALAEHLAAVRHDLRSPVNGILGYLELLEDERHGGLTDRQRRYVANALAASRELLEQIDLAVDLCRVGTTNLTSRPESLELGDWLEPARQLAADEARRRRVMLLLTAGQDPIRVAGDRWLLTRAAYHLLAEILRLAAADSSIAIGVGGDDYRVTIGMTASVRPDADVGSLAVFQSSASSSALGGPIHALGFCRGVVELHGGKSQVTSNAALWSLTFDLPRKP
jgi:signal transduction histidine kinase